MKQLCFLLCFLICLAGRSTFIKTCDAARSMDEARTILFAARVKYDLNSFMTTIAEKDNFMADLFIDSGFDVNAVSDMENTPLKIAVLFNNTEAISKLIATGKLDINYVDKYGRSAADYAQILQRGQIMELLKANGATIKNNNEVTSFSIKDAVRKNYPTKNQALTVAAELAPRKIDMIYESSDTDKVRGGFWGAASLIGRAYWLRPFDVVATNKMEQIRYGKEDEDKINFSNAFYEARVLFSCFGTASINQIDNLKFKVTQNDKEIPIMIILPTTIQNTCETAPLGGPIFWTRAGFILYILADDIRPDIPVEVSTISASAKGLVFRFTNINSTEYSTKEEAFKWTIATSATAPDRITGKI